MDNLGPCRIETTVIALFLVQETRNSVHYQLTPKGAIIRADGVAFKTLSTSAQGLERTDRKLERLYTTAYNRLQ